MFSPYLFISLLTCHNLPFSSKSQSLSFKVLIHRSYFQSVPLASILLFLFSLFPTASSFDGMTSGTFVRHPWCRLAGRFLAPSFARDWGPFISLCSICFGVVNFEEGPLVLPQLSVSPFLREIDLLSVSVAVLAKSQKPPPNHGADWKVPP